MGVVTALFDQSTYNLEEAFRATDRTTEPMKAAIRDWFNLYFQQTPTKEEDPCQRIPLTIINKLDKTAFCEYKASSKDLFAADILASLDQCKGEALQMALIGGECLLKPVPPVKGGMWSWTVVPRSNYLVFGRDRAGRLIDVGTVERTCDAKSYYTLAERRTVDGKGYLTIRNKLFRSDRQGALGVPVSLATLPQYAELPQEYTYPTPVGSVGMVTMRTPMANCVDGSHDGVSVYASAVGLIHNINRNEAQLNTEFEHGKSRLIVSADMLTRDRDGRRRFASEVGVYVGMDGDPTEVGVTIFSPTLREQSFLARKQEYLRNVESVIGLKRGLLSEVEAQERTAKEITSSEGDYNLTIIAFQQMWEDAVREAVKLCGVLGQLYKVAGAHEVQNEDIVLDWGNGVLYDEEKTWADYLDLVSRHMLKPEIALGWRFGMPTETEADLQKIRERFMPEIRQMLEDGE